MIFIIQTFPKTDSYLYTIKCYFQDDDDDLICVGDVTETPEPGEDMENAGSHSKDEFNTKNSDGRVLGNQLGSHLAPFNLTF